MSTSGFVRHSSCPSCGSSDAVSVFQDGGEYCFACRTLVKKGGQEIETSTRAPRELLRGLTYQALTKRKLTEETCRKWGYGVTELGDTPVQVAEYRSPDGELIAQKIRRPDKTFAWRGDSKSVGLYGQHLWRDSGKMVVITEGEIDAMSMSQVQEHKWPVVSIPNGAPAAKKTIAACIEWLERFEKVVFMFDNDEPGRAAAAECAALLTPGKAFIASLPLKDANDMLQAGRSAELLRAMWDAKEYRPDGVLNGADLWSRLCLNQFVDSVPYPWSCLQTKTLGCRAGELVCFVAGTGIGKSEVVRQVVAHFHDHHKERVGYIALEESIERTAYGLMGLHLGTRLYLDPSAVPDTQRKAAFEATVGSGRYFLYDHFGSLGEDTLLSRIRYMVRGCGATTVVLDNLTMAVAGSETDDERKAIDVLIAKLRTMVEELKFRLILVCHLKRVDDQCHEEGAQISLSHIRGSGAIGALCNMVIGLERDQQDEKHSNVTRVRVLKNRYTGELGVGGYLRYDVKTGLLSECEEPKAEATAESHGF